MKASISYSRATGLPEAGAARALQPAREARAVPHRFEQMYADFSPYVMRVLPRMGVAGADLDDVTQEVFLAVHRGLPMFEGRSREKTWVYGICMRVCSNYRKRAHRRHEDRRAEPPELLDAGTPECRLQTSRALSRLDATLARLPDIQRAVFVLHEIEALAVTEIAEALGCSKFTVYARLYAAQRAVRVGMRDHAEKGEGHD